MATIAASFRSNSLVYLDGNSLGALTQRSASRVRSMVEDQWGTGLIRSWNTHGWFELPSRLGARIAPLIGADADEVLVADSTSAPSSSPPALRWTAAVAGAS